MKRKLFIVAMSIIIGSLSLLAGCQKSDSEQQIQYYESGDNTKLKEWLYENCIDGV